MQAKRLIVLLASVVAGIALTLAIIYLRIPLGPVTFGFGTDVRHFAYSNVFLLFISIASVFFIWLDYFLDTKFLRS